MPRLIVSSAIIVIGSLVIAPSAARAGQPWNCVCKGQPKRFIASTYMCEHDLYRGSGTRVSSGFTLYVKPCTKAQFLAWQRKACKMEGCKPPR